MLTAESSGSVLANVIPVVAPPTASKSGGKVGTRRQQSVATAVASRNGSCFRKGRQYSVKTFRSLAIVLLLGAVGCREKPIDQGALITARTVGLEHLQRGRLPEAEQEFKTVIALAPRDPLGYANLGLTYLRAGRYAEAETELDRGRRLRPEPPREAKPTLDAALQALRAGRMANARAELDRLLRLLEVTAPYQAALAEVDGIEGPLAGRPVLAFSPQSLITMRGIGSAPASAKVQFTDVTGETGFPEGGAPVTALAWGDYDGEGEDNLLVASGAGARLYAVHGGFVADVSANMPLPLAAGAVVAAFPDYDNDGRPHLFAIGTHRPRHLLHNCEGKRFGGGTPAARGGDV